MAGFGEQNRLLPPRATRFGFNGTIASGCESVGISVGEMIEMMRWAKESDPGIAQFLDAWDALDPSERKINGMTESIRRRVGLKIPELLGIVAEVAYRTAMHRARIIAAIELPSIVERSLEIALTAEGIADRKMLFQHSGFLPTPTSSQTTINVAQNTQAYARPVVAAPLPERTTRRLTDELYERLRRQPVLAGKNECEPIEVSNRGDDNGE